MTLSTTILQAQEFARRLTLKADGVVLAYDEALGGFSWSSATPATPVTTGTAAQRAAITGSAGQLFHETDTSVLLQWTAAAAAWKAVAAPGAWTSASRPPVGTTDAAYEGLEIYEQNTGKVMVLRRTTLGVAISGGNPLIWSYVSPLITVGSRITITGDGSPGSPFVLTPDAMAPTAGAGIAVSGVSVINRNRTTLGNPIRNASMQIAQRGTSIAGTFSSTWTLDGWQAHRSGVAGATVTQQAAADTQGSQLCIRVQRDSGNANTTALSISQSVVTNTARHYAGKQVTFSYRARCGANFSAASSLMSSDLGTGTGTDQNRLAGFTGSAIPISVNATLTTSWQTFTGTATLATNATEFGVVFSFVPVGTAGAADYFEVKDVRVDEGAYAGDHIVLPYAVDYADARHYLRVYGGTANVPVGWGSTWGGVYGANASVHYVTFDTPMRAAPTGSQTGNWEVYNLVDGASDVTNVTSLVMSPWGGYVVEYRAAGNWVSQSHNALLRPKDTTARLILTAEI